jgi:hypothetical protein
MRMGWVLVRILLCCQIHYKKEKNKWPLGFCLRVDLFTPIQGRRGRWTGWFPDWDEWAYIPGPLHGHTSGWQEGLRWVFLTTQTRGRLFVPDTNLLWGPRSWFVDGDYSGNLHLGHRIGDEEVLMGRRFWVGGGFFSSGEGEGKTKLQNKYSWVVFEGRHEFQNSPFYFTYYILSSGGFAAASSDQGEGSPDPRWYFFYMFTEFRDLLRKYWQCSDI